ncbi:MAG TPA: NAD(P)/FAD-dependent oxidoreductase [Bryobacteraceae bacterium]|nr:NAD(P)/FAD-dependent oxidoreductase [Bryobacteraceae bacterium]
MANERTPEVLIVGAGPVGLFTALALSRRGIRVQVVDTGVWAVTHSYALALHPQSLKLLQSLGLLERVLDTGYIVRGIALFDGSSRRAQVHVERNGDPASCVAVLGQDALEHVLERALQDHGVRVSWKHEVSALAPERDRVVATIDEYEQESRGYVVARTEWVVARSARFEAAYVVGADGYNSRVRRALNIDFPEVGAAQYYAVFEFESDFDAENEIRIALGERTTDVLWPLPEGYCRWSFELPGYSDAEAEALQEHFRSSGSGSFPAKRSKDRRLAAQFGAMPELDENALRRFLGERAPWFKGSIDHLTWKTIVRFERRLAGAYGRERLWLAGDAAHLTGPVGIQSMNVGLAEANDLADALARVLRDRADPQQLAGYGQRWTAEWRRLHGIDGGLAPHDGADPWIAQNAHRLMTCLPAHGAELNALAGQLRLKA